MKVCTNCGKKNRIRDYYCVNCGTSFRHIFFTEKDKREYYEGNQNTLSSVSYLNNTEKIARKISELIRNKSYSQIYDESRVLFEKKDSTAAIWCLEYLVENQHKEAAWDMAVNYGNGNYVDINHNKSIELFTHFAQEGNEVAMFNIGLNYSKLDDDKNAFYWFKKAGENDYEDAFVRVGWYYKQTGDTKNAYRWFEKAANHGDIEGCFYLALHYKDRGEESLYIKFMELSAEGGLENAFSLVADFYLKKGHYQLAIKWYEKAADKNIAIAQYNLGAIYLDHFKEYKRALKWLELASSNGMKEADELLNEVREILAN